MRILIFGGRKFVMTDDYAESLQIWLRKMGATEVIHGDAPGVDKAAGRVASEIGIHVRAFPADWSLGPKAGPIRNQQMIDAGRPDYGIGFPGGAGTADMLRRLRKAGIRVKIIE